MKDLPDSGDTPGVRSLRLAAAAVALFAFAFTFLTFRGLSNDHYMHLGWAQQLRFGELPGRDFVDPGMPLQYTVSALVQWLWPGPFSEAVASMAFLALAAGCVSLVTSGATRSTVAGVVAGLVATAWLPRLYSYPKVLVPAVTLLLVHRFVRRPARPAAALAAWTVAATLFRHDLGIFAALATGSALLVAGDVPVRERVRRVAAYGLCAAAVSIPYVGYVQWSEGLLEHVRVANEFAKTDAHQLLILPRKWPTFGALAPAAWLAGEPDTVLFWLTHVLILVVAALAVREIRRGSAQAPVVVAAFVFLLCYRITILRHSLRGRLPDLASVYAVCAVVVVAEAVRFVRARLTAKPVLALAAAGIAAAGIVPAMLAMERVVNLRSELDQSGIIAGPGAAIARGRQVLGRAASGSWEAYWPAGDVPPAIAYLTACTGDRDRLLTTWPAPEYHFFARKPFAAGHLSFFHRDAFSSERDQLRTLERLRHQYVPVVLINETTYEQFRDGFPLVADYIAMNYASNGRFTIRDGSEVAIAVRRDLKPRRTFGDEQWPCDFVAGAVPPGYE